MFLSNCVTAAIKPRDCLFGGLAVLLGQMFYMNVISNPPTAWLSPSYGAIAFYGGNATAWGLAAGVLLGLAWMAVVEINLRDDHRPRPLANQTIRSSIALK